MKKEKMLPESLTILIKIWGLISRVLAQTLDLMEPEAIEGWAVSMLVKL